MIPRPSTIDASFWAWIAGAVLSVTALPLTILLNSGHVIDELSGGHDESRQLPTALVALLVGGSFVLMAVFAVPYVVCATQLRRGRPWARGVLAGLAGPALIGAVLMLPPIVDAPVRIPGFLMVALVLAVTIMATVLMFVPASNRFVR